MNKIPFALAATAAAVLLAACGGGGGGEAPVAAPPAPPAAGSTTLSGVAAKGPLKAAVVRAFPVDANGAVGSAAIASATTAADGSYTLNLGGYGGAVQIVASADAATRSADEATGQDVALPADFALRANTVVPAPAAGATATQAAAVTPFTELAHRIAAAAGGATPANIASANGVVFALIGVDPVGTLPVASNSAPPAGASEAQKRYGLFNAAVSQLATQAPATADADTRACFTAAAADAGRRIACATQQVAGAVTVAGSGSAATTTVNSRLVGLADALVAVAANPQANRSGAVIPASDSAVTTLQSLASAAAAGTPAPVSGGTSPQTRGDIALAKAFFSNLRANAAVLETGPLETGIVDGVERFGRQLGDDAARVGGNTTDLLTLTEVAFTLWDDYTNRRTTNPNSAPIFGLNGGCTVYQGSFPTAFGGSAGANGQPSSATSTPASDAANASWVACSVNSTPTLVNNGAPRWRQTIAFDFAADRTLASVPWMAATRQQVLQNNVSFQTNLTPMLAGRAGLTLTQGEITGLRLVGDLPPEASSSGTLLAARYPVDVQGSAQQQADGTWRVALAGGRFGIVPVGASVEALRVDLSPGGTSVAVIANDVSSAAQLAASRLDFAATVSSPLGSLSGSFAVDRFVLDASGSALPQRVRFTGEASVAPNGSGAPVRFLAGTIEVTDGAQPTLSFDGSLSLPNRPAATLALSITESGSGTSATSTLSGRYVQGGVTVTISGSETAQATSTTFADSTGVSATVRDGENTTPVTVSGRPTATIDRNSRRITYADGTFETLW